LSNELALFLGYVAGYLIWVIGASAVIPRSIRAMRMLKILDVGFSLVGVYLYVLISPVHIMIWVLTVPSMMLGMIWINDAFRGRYYQVRPEREKGMRWVAVLCMVAFLALLLK